VKRAAIIPCRGIGDALLMMIAAHQLLQAGFETHVFHPLIGQLKDWFPSGHIFHPFLPEDLTSYSLVIAQNDNSIYLQTLRASFPSLILFYPTYFPHKHRLSPHDYIFDPNQTMVANIADAMAQLLKRPFSSDNGLKLPTHLETTVKLQRNPLRIAIHPTSSDPKKNWPFKRFISLSQKLKKRGWHPFFLIYEKEKIAPTHEEVIQVKDLENWARLIYEVGFVIGNDSLAGHLASNLGIPTLTIGNCDKRLRLWRPGWREGKVILPSRYLPNFKGLRLRERYWQYCISTRYLLKQFLRFTSSTDFRKQSAIEKYIFLLLLLSLPFALGSSVSFSLTLPKSL
jgi:heptosyltransferase III